MTTAYEIPLIASPQTLSVQLAGVPYQLTVRWNAVQGAWVTDLADAQGDPVLSGVPFVCGADLFEQFGYLGFGGALVAQSDFDPAAPPTFDNLGSTGHVYFVTNP